MDLSSYIEGWRRRQVEEAAAAARRRGEATERLRPVARLLVERFGARRVILFGSRARGAGGPGSDLDLAVEGLPEHRYFEALRAVRRALGGEAVDLVRTEEAGALLGFQIDRGVPLHG